MDPGNHNQTGVQLSELRQEANDGDLQPNYRVRGNPSPSASLSLGLRDGAKAGWSGVTWPPEPGEEAHTGSQKPDRPDSISAPEGIIRAMLAHHRLTPGLLAHWAGPRGQVTMWKVRACRNTTLSFHTCLRPCRGERRKGSSWDGKSRGVTVCQGTGKSKQETCWGRR